MVTIIFFIISLLSPDKFYNISYFIIFTSTNISNECELKINFLINQNMHVVDTQKNRLNETVLLSTQNMCLKQYIVNKS